MPQRTFCEFLEPVTCVQPDDPWIAAEPRLLPAGEAARPLDREVEGLLERRERVERVPRWVVVHAGTPLHGEGRRHDHAVTGALLGLELVREADVQEGARAIGFTLGTPDVGMLGVVDDILADRAFIEERQTSAAELCTVSDLASDAPHVVAVNAADRAFRGRTVANVEILRRIARAAADGMDDILVRYARCCNPLPGDRWASIEKAVKPMHYKSGRSSATGSVRDLD